MKALFCSFDSPGYLFPLAGLALELRRRGHEVAFATGLPARDTLAAEGLERIERTAHEGASFQVQRWFDPVATAIDVKHVEHAIGRFAPDVLVTHPLCQAPLLARERRGVPVAVLGLFSYLWPGDPAAPDDATRRWRATEGIASLNAARAAFRMPPLPVDGARLPQLGDLFMLRTVPELEPELAAYPAEVRAVGPCLWEPARDEAGAWEALRARFARPEAPLVYAQPGRTFAGPGFWPQMLEAMAGEPAQVVASVGRMDSDAGDPPPNVLAEAHVPQGLVMPHAGAVVSGGTTSVVLAALAHGLPHVIVAGGGETTDNARKLSDAGLALHLPAEGLTPPILRDALARALADAPLRARCHGARRALARMDGFGIAAELVEQLAEGERYEGTEYEGAEYEDAAVRAGAPAHEALAAGG